MKFKKILGILLLTSMTLTSLAGCKKDVKPAENKGTDDKKPITFTVFSADVNSNYENFESPVAQKIKEKTGVTLKIEYPVGDLAQKIGLMIAGKEYPDFIFAKGEQNKLIQAGALKDLTSLIDKHGPNIKNLYGDYLKRLKYSKADPSIYYVGTGAVGAERWEPSSGFELQHAVVKELGYPKIETLQDFENAIKAYKEKHPTIDGQPTIGLSLLADDWRWLITVGNPSGFAAGMPDDGQWYIDPNTYKAEYKFVRPELKDYFKWLNHMNDIKLLDPDSFVQKYDQYKAKISSGRVLALADAKWEYNDGQKPLIEAKKFERTYGQYPVVLNKGIKYADFRDTGYSAGWGVGISTSCKDPERAMKFLDWMATDEAQILNNWGIQDVHYKIVDGKRVIPDEEWSKRTADKDYFKKTGIGVYGWPFPQQGDGKKDPSGQTYTPTTKDSILKDYNAVEKEVLSAYGKKMWMDLYPSKDQFKVPAYGAAWQVNIPQDSDLAVNLRKCDDVMKVKLPKAVMCKPSEFDSVWSEIMSDLKKSNVDKIGDDFTKLVKEKIDFWK